MGVATWKDAVVAVIAITLMSMLCSVMIAGIMATILDLPLRLQFALGVPAIGVPIFAIPLVRANLRLTRARAELERLVRTDSLTGLSNRRHFLEKAAHIFSLPQAEREGGIAVMMVDIDHFKQINDTCGHSIGDKVLKSVADAILATTLGEHPGRAVAGRIGGEEFAIVAYGLDLCAATGLADRICQAVRRVRWSKLDQVVTPTVSIGVALREAGESFAATLKAADAAVYHAKAMGRDRWCLARRDPEPSYRLPLDDRDHGTMDEPAGAWRHLACSTALEPPVLPKPLLA